MATANQTVPAGVWTLVASGPAEALITGSDNFEYAWAASPPAVGFFGHKRFAGVDLVAPIFEGENLYVYNALRPFTLARTVDAA